MASTPKAPYFGSDTTYNASCVADASLASSTHLMMKKTSTGVNVCGAGEDHFGILYNAPASGEYAEVADGGSLHTGKAAAAVAVGDNLKTAASGKLTPASSGDQCCGIALSAASGDGVLFVFKPARFQAA
jgi:hypothetical protein